jgi:hypothetical protein
MDATNIATLKKATVVVVSVALICLAVSAIARGK